MAHQDFLSLKADAKAKAMYGGSSVAMGGTQARKIAPEMVRLKLFDTRGKVFPFD